jgi:hypothetical protein
VASVGGKERERERRGEREREELGGPSPCGIEAV